MKKPKSPKRDKPTEQVREEEREGGTTLLLVDMQNCKGADEDAQRVAAMITENINCIDRIIATLDIRYKLHISHAGFWINDDGFHPEPNTEIKSKDVQSGKYVPNPKIQLSDTDVMVESKSFQDYNMILNDDKEVDLYQYAIQYLTQLEASGRFNHTIWPEHCLMGTDGSNIVPSIMEAIMEWTDETGKSVEWLDRGQNTLTEMTSVMRADVVVSEDTEYNYDFLSSLLLSEKLLVAGQAKSHAVNWSLRDILEWWPEVDTNRIVLLMDGTSPVEGFEKESQALEVYLTARGVQINSIADEFP